MQSSNYLCFSELHITCICQFFSFYIQVHAVNRLYFIVIAAAGIKRSIVQMLFSIKDVCLKQTNSSILVEHGLISELLDALVWNVKHKLYVVPLCTNRRTTRAYLCRSQFLCSRYTNVFYKVLATSAKSDRSATSTLQANTCWILQFLSVSTKIVRSNMANER